MVKFHLYTFTHLVAQENSRDMKTYVKLWVAIGGKAGSGVVGVFNQETS